MHSRQSPLSYTLCQCLPPFEMRSVCVCVSMGIYFRLDIFTCAYVVYDTIFAMVGFVFLVFFAIVVSFENQRRPSESGTHH